MCNHITKKGTHCRANNLKGQAYCVKHKPLEHKNIESNSEIQPVSIVEKSEPEMPPQYTMSQKYQDGASLNNLNGVMNIDSILKLYKHIKQSSYIRDKKSEEFAYSLNGLYMLIRVLIDRKHQFFWAYSKVEAKKFVDQLHALDFECHEVLWSQNCMFFCDIDLIMPINMRDELLSRMSPDEVFGSIVCAYEQAIALSFKKHNITLNGLTNENDLLIIKRCRCVDTGYKYSIHLISNFWMAISEAKALAKDIYLQLDHIKTDIDIKLLKDGFDIQPYKRFGSLSMLGGVKNGYRNELHIQMENYHNQYISVYHDDVDILPMHAYPVDAPRSNIVIDNQFIQEAIKQVGNIPDWSDAFDIDASSLKGCTMIIRRVRPSECSICNRTHDSDNTLLLSFDSSTFKAYWKCLHAIGQKAKLFYKRSLTDSPIDSVVEQVDYNCFQEDNYYWDDLCSHLDNTQWDRTKPDIIEYLKTNLHRVLAIVGENVIIKRSPSQFFDMRQFNKMTSQLVHWIPVEMKPPHINLGVLINMHKKHFKLFHEIICNFEFDCPNNRTFVASRQFVAKRINNYRTEAIDTLLGFVHRDLFSSNDELFQYELDKLACMVKYPYRKTGVITLLIGEQGCGKNTYTDFLCERVFGSYNSISNMPGIETLLEDKNGEQFGKKLIVVNEMAATKDKFMSNFNKLKGMITEKSQRIRMMYMNGFMAEQSTDYYCISNHIGSYVIESDKSRRELVPDISKEHADDRSYWGPIKRMIDTQACGDAFYSYLLDRPITYDEFMSKPVPMTETKRKIVDNCKSYETMFVEHFMMHILPELGESEDRKIMSSVMNSKYINWCQCMGINPNNDPFKKLKNAFIAAGYEPKRTKKGMEYKF